MVSSYAALYRNESSTVPTYPWPISSSHLSWSFTTANLGVGNMYRIIYNSYKSFREYELQQYLHSFKI